MDPQHLINHNSMIKTFIKILESAKNIGDRIFDIFPVVFVLTDNSGRILKANALAQELFNQSEAELLGQFLKAAAPPSAAEFLQTYYGETQRLETANIEFETRSTGAGGQDKFIFWQVNKIADVRELRVGLHIIVASDVTQLRRDHERIIAIEQDLKISKAVQNYLLPAQGAFENEDFHVAGYYRAADNVGGDWWWYETKDDGRLHLLLGDVIGHGVGAAMVTAKIAAAYTVVSRKAQSGTTMCELLAELNSHIFLLNDPNFSMSVFAAICDPRTQKVELCFCGGRPMAILRKGKPAATYRAGGDLLGWNQGIAIGQRFTEFASGDRLFACTDGTFEFPAKNGKAFGLHRAFKLATKFRDLDAKSACQAIMDEIDRARASRYDDDLSFVIVDRK